MQLPEVRYSFTVPCCYMFLTDEGFPLSTQVNDLIPLLKNDFYQSTAKI